jgi:1-pyrroline-5-carboxylate dehydrogenase
MNNAIFKFAKPINEPVKAYAPGTPEKTSLKKALTQLSSEEWDIPLIIGGKEIRTGNTGKVVMPHDHKHVLATYHKAGEKEVQMAIDTAMKAHKEWSELPWVERASLMMRTAELFATKYRYLLNASVMLGQSKSPFQAEIDAPCELIDFLRFSAFYAGQIYEDQPYSDTGIINRMEYRALEGFVFSLSPFNFTSIAGNLNMAPAMMGNVAVWKPSTTAIHSNYLLMKVFQEAGLPDGVVNFIPGQGSIIGKVITASPDLAGFHFTGSTATFNTLWRQMGNNLENYKSYPKIVGETGGKNFIFVHPSSPALEVATAIVRGAFEYQGQKCSAGSRAYIPKSLWKEIKEQVGDMLKDIKMGDPQDFTNFFNAVIDEASFDNIMSYIDYAKEAPDAEIIFGGKGDKSVGYFVEPTVIQTTNPQFKSMTEEIFGPVMTIYVYDDNKFEETLALCDRTSPYGLTGSIFARDRYAIQTALDKLRYAAGNFYINDKPTGAVIAQQPFGGSRASGTNDKAGGPLNLIRWTNARTIKEALVPPTDYRYPFLQEK